MPYNAVHLSCEQCKRRKTKCNKGSPCSACEAGDLTCTPVQRARLPRGKTGKIKGKNAALEDKVARLESLVGRLETQFQSDGVASKAYDVPISAEDLEANAKPVQYANKIESFVARDFWTALSNEVSQLLVMPYMCCRLAQLKDGEDSDGSAGCSAFCALAIISG